MRGRPPRLRERGAAAVEFALVLPLLILLVLGGVDWGYYFFAGEIVGNAAREGARAGALLPIAVDPCAGDASHRGAQDLATEYLVRGRLIGGSSDPRLLPWDCSAGTSTTPPGSCCRNFCVPSGSSAPCTNGVEVKVVYQARRSRNSMSITGFLNQTLLPNIAAATSTMKLEP
jgi:Flp pilus assembly protein TadG